MVITRAVEHYLSNISYSSLYNINIEYRNDQNEGRNI